MLLKARSGSIGRFNTGCCLGLEALEGQDRVVLYLSRLLEVWEYKSCPKLYHPIKCSLTCTLSFHHSFLSFALNVLYLVLTCLYTGGKFVALHIYYHVLFCQSITLRCPVLSCCDFLSCTTLTFLLLHYYAQS